MPRIIFDVNGFISERGTFLWLAFFRRLIIVGRPPFVVAPHHATDPEEALLDMRMNARSVALSRILKLSLFDVSLLNTLWLRKRLERLRVSASGRGRGTRNSSNRPLRHKV